MQPILHNNDQSTSERVFDAVAQQGTPRYHRDAPEICTSTDVHDWCDVINCDLCAARALALSSGEFGDLGYTFPSHQLISEAPTNSGHCDDPLIQPNAFHVGNIQGDLNTPRYLGQQTFDTNGQDNTLFGPSIASGQSDQAIPSSEPFPILHRASDWNNPTSSRLIDQHSAHPSIVMRQGNPIPLSGLSYYSHPYSRLFPQEPPRNCGGANRTKSTNSISTSPLFENIPASASSMDMQLSPYGDHSRYFCGPHGYIPYTRSAATASAADNSTRTSPSRPRFACARKKTYAVGYEPDIGKLQDRCRLSGAENTAVDLFPTIFPAGITLEALTRHRTSTEIETAQFGGGGGPVYLVLLEQVMKAEGEGSVIAYRCRLCPDGGDAFAWKKPRDALRHLRRNHLGLGDCCPRW